MNSRRVVAPEDLRRPPLYATRRNPELRTRGGKIGVLARELGRTLLPHQQYIADVATELAPPGSRYRYRYQTVVVSLPRQTGKTTLLRPVFLERCMTTPATQAFMTAQLGKDAAARWNDLVSDLEESTLLRSFTSVLRGKGGERLTFPNRSFISPFAPGKKSLHGYSPPLVFVDEGWAFSQEEAADLMKAIRPAQQTKTDRQLWIVSAAGDNTSVWWNELQAAGRAATKDPASHMAYFEWAMAPDADPYDPASWEFHPGLDGLITIEDLAQEADPAANSLADFLRGFMNVSTKTRDNTVVDLGVWGEMGRGDQTPPEPEALAWAYDVAEDRTSASVWAAWRDDAGKVQLHVVETREGWSWLTDYVDHAMNSDARPAIVGAVDGGPARLVTDELRRRGHQIDVLGGRDAVTAWTNFKALVGDKSAQHDRSAALRAALEIAAERTSGDGLALSRRLSLGAIDPLVSAMAAAYLAERVTTTVPIY